MCHAPHFVMSERLNPRKPAAKRGSPGASGLRPWRCVAAASAPWKTVAVRILIRRLVPAARAITSGAAWKDARPEDEAEYASDARGLAIAGIKPCLLM